MIEMSDLQRLASFLQFFICNSLSRLYLEKQHKSKCLQCNYQDITDRFDIGHMYFLYWLKKLKRESFWDEKAEKAIETVTAVAIIDTQK